CSHVTRKVTWNSVSSTRKRGRRRCPERVCSLQEKSDRCAASGRPNRPSQRQYLSPLRRNPSSCNSLSHSHITSLLFDQGCRWWFRGVRSSPAASGSSPHAVWMVERGRPAYKVAPSSLTLRGGRV